MKARPILMHGRSIRSILAGRKTQTRRIVKPQPVRAPTDGRWEWAPPTWFQRANNMSGHGFVEFSEAYGSEVVRACCPKGLPGDLLYVRENGWQPKEPTMKELREGADTWPAYAYDADGIAYSDREDFVCWGWKRRPSIHMPRWASRITLRLTDVRVERVQQISPGDCEAEGCSVLDTLSGYHRGAALHTQFIDLWDQTNGKGAYKRNDWCWVLCFELIEANVDDVLADPARYGLMEAA